MSEASELSGSSKLVKPEELLLTLRERGVRLELEGDQLRLQAPKGAILPAEQAALREHKSALISLLQAESLRPHGLSRYPLTSVQKRLWFLQQLEPHSTRYHEAAALRLNGRPDSAKLKQVLTAWVARHDILRSSFHYEQAELYQQVHPAAEHPPELTLGHAAEIEDFVQLPFDLSQGPLFRVGLFLETQAETTEPAHKAQETDQTVFVLVFHHLITDFWSAGLALNELNALWLGESLPEPSLQYGDYAIWQSHQPIPEAALENWRNMLQDVPLGLELGQRRDQQPGTGGLIELPLTAELVERWRTVAASHQVTRFVWLLSAWQVWLCRNFRLEAGVIAFPSVGRPRRELEKMLGCFVNTQLMPFAYQPDVQLSFSELVAQTQSTLLEVLDQSTLPFETLVEVLKPPRELSYFPQLGIVMQDSWQIENQQLQLGEYSAEWLELDLAPKFEILLSWLGFRQSLRLNFDAGLFDSRLMQRLLSDFIPFFEATLNQPSLPLNELPLVDFEQAWALKQRWLPQQPVYPGWLHQFVEKHTLSQPDAVALRWGNQTISYAELNSRANRWARALQTQGVILNDRVAVRLKVSPDLIVALLAILKVGAAYVPIDEDCPQERMLTMLADCQPSLLIAAEDTLASTQETHLNGLSPHQLDDLAKNLTQPNADQNLNLQLMPDALAYIIYTSGSTGRPNGVCITHACASRLFTSIAPVFPTDADDVWLMFHSVAFDYTVWEIWGCFFGGGSLVLLEREQLRNPAETWETVLKQGVTILNQTPSAFRYLSRVACQPDSKGQFTSGKLKKLLLSGEKLELNWLKDWFSVFQDTVEVYTSYGITETTVFVTWRRLYAAELSLGRSMIGAPLADLGIRILDEQLQPVPIGVPGELCVLGPGLAPGYWQRPELTAQRYVRDPETGERLYRSGDLVRVDPDDEIIYLGRRDLQIKLRGYRIETGEIQNVIESLPGVRAAHVALRETTGGPQLLAWVQPAELNPARLRQQLTGKLPGPMLPAQIIPLEQFPLNQNGKVDTRALPLETLAEPEQQRAEQDAQAEALRPDTSAPDYSLFNQPGDQLAHQLGQILAQLLGRRQIGLDENFFELGGHSLLMVEAREKIQHLTGLQLELVDLFQYPTLRQLAHHLRPLQMPADESTHLPFLAHSGQSLEHNEPIAIIGMALKVPGANSPEAFWDLLSQGRESVRFWTEAELREAGISETEFRHPDYVPASAWCEGLENFDAEYFGYSPREAEMLDPQQRLMLELALETLERAGYGDTRQPQSTGIFASSGISRYLLFHLSRQPLLETVNPMQVLISTDKDFLATRVAHKLNLTGPALMVQSACSSSLAAVHLACESLRRGECQTALAGGVSLDTLPQGYRWLEGAIYSRDGHCRPFDAEASGIIGGSGGAWVLLKPLSAALADGDTVYACIQGSALNNDGADKAGYLAPSVTGQRRVIEAALAHANVKPQQIGVVEAHGTGTAIGDPIELRALRQAWRLNRPETGPFCALGSLKGNLGHLDAAAGVASLIKTALMLHHQKIVPTINVRRPNPQLLLEQSPFYLANQLQSWSGPGRHAAVSSLGIGGTNVHLILAAAPEQASSLQTSAESEGPVILPISAPTQASFKQLTANLSQSLAKQVNQDPPISLSDLAYSLQQGRQPQAWRGYLSISQPSKLVESLAQLKATKAPESEALIFLCPGLGSQQPGMGQGLYDALPAYRESIQRSQAQLNKLDWGHHLKTLLLSETDRALLAQPEIMQPLIFCHGLALASGLISLGLRPSAVIGHSFGEYLAVTLAGLAEPDEMLELVLKRGKLFASLPEAGVISVAASLEQVEPWLDKLSEQLVIAAINAADRLTVSGSRKALTEFLNQSQLPGRWLDIPHAVHHPMLDGILPALTEAAAAVHWQKPRLPVLSGLSAKWHKSIPHPQYWAEQARQQILFDQGLAQLQTSELKNPLGLELGTGKTLSALLQRRGLEAFAGPTGESGLQQLLGELWLRGQHPDWSALNHEAESHRRLPLPPTPRQHRRYWIPAKPPGTAAASDKLRRDFSDWFELALWRQAPLARAEATDYLFLGSEQADLPAHLPKTLLIIWPEIQPDQNAFKQALQAFEHQRQRLLQLIKQGWQGRLIWLCSAFSSITGHEELKPWPALLIGFVRSLAFEAPGIQARLIETDTGLDPDDLLKLPTAEWAQSEPHVAWRSGRRWLPERVPAGEAGLSPLKSQGVYVITGASGGMGQALAEFLQQRYQARLVLISRQALPDQPDTLPLTVDVTGPEQLKAALASAKAYFGQIDGIFHCAGLPGGHLLAQLTPEILEQTLAAKIWGSLNLKQAIDQLDLNPDFVVLASSVASQLGSPGQSAYAAANAWLDAWAQQQGAPWQSINWGTWRDGMAGRALSHLPAAWRPLYQHFLNLGMEAHEGTAAFERLLSYNWPQLTVSPVSVETLGRLQSEALQSALSQPTFQREQIESDMDEPQPADPPQGELENMLADVWQRCLGRSPGREDRFGALGGDSLMVVQMKALLEQALGQELPLGLFLEDLSLKALAAGISGEAKPSEELLIKLNGVETGKPLFFVHAISGTVFPFRHLAAALDKPFYGLQSRGLISPRPHLDLSAMARDYRRVIEERFAPPYHIGGWSFGGLVAWEMARQWLAEGTDVSELILLDMQAPVPGIATNIDDQGLRERFEADLAGLGPLALAEQMKERLWRIFEAHVQATLNYQPDVSAELKPKTLLLIAEKGFGATHPAPDLGWSPWLDQPEILRIPGDHYSCLDEENLNSWAKRLNQ